MADVETALFAKITGTSAITALVGTRVFPVAMPQETELPAIVYFKVSGNRVNLLSAPSNLAHPRFQFDIYARGADGYKKSKAVAKQLRLALNGFRGVVSGVDIQSCILDDEQDPYEEEPELYRVTLDFLVMHRE